MRVDAHIMMSAQVISLIGLASLGQVELESDQVDYHDVSKVWSRRQDGYLALRVVEFDRG